MTRRGRINISTMLLAVREGPAAMQFEKGGRTTLGGWAFEDGLLELIPSPGALARALRYFRIGRRSGAGNTG